MIAHRIPWRKEENDDILVGKEQDKSRKKHSVLVRWCRGGMIMTEQILAVQRMQEYIEMHLEAEIILAELAAVSRFLSWYSYRLFREHTGLTVADYANAIFAASCAMDRYDPRNIGYEWDETNPRIQLEPIGSRGYIELRPVKKR